MTVLSRLQVYLGLPALLLFMIWALVGTLHGWRVMKAPRSRAVSQPKSHDSVSEPPSPMLINPMHSSDTLPAPSLANAKQAGRPSNQLVEAHSSKQPASTPQGSEVVPKNKVKRKKTKDTFIQRGLRATAITCFIAYLTVSKEAIGSFTCIKVGSSLLLARDLRVSCDSSVRGVQ